MATKKSGSSKKAAKTSSTRLPAGALVKLRKLLATNANVVGFSGVLRDEQVRGKPTGRRVIRVYTAKRITPRQRAKSGIPLTMSGVPIDLMEIGEPVPEGSPAMHRKKYRPMVGGISAISAHQGGSGTLGYFVQDAAPPPPGKLSLIHI